MRTLVIDSATEACSVALFEDGACLAGELRLLGRGHAEQLVPMIAALPNKGRAERIVVSLGPGSFTGLRVGLAAARALALVWGSEVAGYPTVALVAAMARKQRGDQPLAVAMTGGHGEWFVARYGADGAELHPCIGQIPDVAAQTPELLVAGSQAEALVTARGFGEALPLRPDAREFALLDPAELRPPQLLYGRAPDARLPTAAAR
jgi:tRNA threonylcarbamoyl adenosine modification protein YeaZ